MSGGNARRNVIQGCKVGRSLTGGTNGKTLLEVQNTNDKTPLGDVVDTAETETSSATSSGAQDSPTRRHRRKGGEVPLEFFKQKGLFSGPLLPSEVCYLGKFLFYNLNCLCLWL
jgi:DNA-directed RNA polymerase I subunit RPA1